MYFLEYILVGGGFVAFMIAIMTRLLHLLLWFEDRLYMWQRVVFVVGGIGGFGSSVFVIYTGRYNVIFRWPPPDWLLIFFALVGISLICSAWGGKVRVFWPHPRA